MPQRERNACHVFRAAAIPELLLRAAADQRGEQHGIARKNRTGSLRAIDLVAGDSQKIHRFPHDVLHIERDDPGRLNGVRMEKNAVFFTEFPDAMNIIDNTGFIVCRHDGHEAGIFRHLSFYRGQIYLSVRIWRTNLQIKVRFYAQFPRSLQNAVVFDGGNHHTRLSAPAKLRFNARNDHVVPLTAAGGEDHLLRIAVKKPCHLVTRFVYRFSRRFSVRVQRTGVTELISEIRHHCVQDSRMLNNGYAKSDFIIVRVIDYELNAGPYSDDPVEETEPATETETDPEANSEGEG